ncbi:MAG: glycosyltransferase family 9 protein [Kiritimatiellaeota bacterium]|nr:glycosyltransferase family 9 protein [Kiritimatiellota bacterium]
MDLSPQKILIVKPSALGDIIHTLPVLNALRRRFPNSIIDWVVAKGLHPVLENHPMIGRLWIIDKNKWKKLGMIKETFAEIAKLRKALKVEEYDLVIDLQGLLRTGLIAKFTGSPNRLGFASAREGAPLFYTEKIKVDWENIHAVDRYLKLVEPLGCDIRGVEFPLPPFNEDISLLDELPARFALVSPSAGKEANRWPAERFGEVAANLDLPSVVIGDPGSIDLAEIVVANSNGKAVSVAGRTSILELVALIKRAELLIANDTGPIHIAAALNIPVCAVFGPANPTRTGPYGDIHSVVSLNLPCSPCYAKKRDCDWKCLCELDSDLVLRAARSLLQFS